NLIFLILLICLLEYSLHLLIPSPVPTELHLPRPHLSVLPGHEVIAGADVMFRCSSTHPSTSCYLYLEGQIRAQLLSRERGDYNLSHVQNGDSGRYSCQCYTINASREWSAVSNTLDLVPRISLGCPLALCVPLDPLLSPREGWDLPVGGSPVTVPCVPADYTLCNAVRLALAAALLLLMLLMLLGPLTVGAARSHCWRSRC
uniref:Ig-like domain-containing protein n=1 Tax=Cyanistes caeruleus TaxID=156563 RepID=A0A8C0ZAY2_CYACU